MQETTDGGLKARAGVLTLLFLTASMDREALLQMLADARRGGLLRKADPDEYEQTADEDFDALEDDFDDEEELEFEEDEFDDDLDLDLGALDPDTAAVLSPAGVEALFVAFTLQRWLRDCPRDPLEIGEPAAGDAIAALLCCWSATVTHGLAAEPRTLSELDEVVELLDFETLDEHVVALERSGLVETHPDNDGTTRYTVTDWLREGIAPIAAAARHERHHPADDTLPPDRLDVEAAFQLALPLVTLPAELSGSCRLDVQLDDGGGAANAGATVQVERGRVVPSESRPGEQPNAWASGTAVEWLDAVVDPNAVRLEVGGDTRLVEALIAGLYEALFGIRVR